MAIAKATGVSRATVSLVLNGGGASSSSTQAKVMAAAHKMGYRPNALVHSIRSGKSRTVGVLVHPFDSYWREICYGIHDRLLESDHLPLFLWNTDHVGTANEEYALKQIHKLLDHWVDGVILWPYFADVYAHHLREFEVRNIPLVTIDHSLSNLVADTVATDEAQLAGLIAQHLSALGHREILIVSGPSEVAWANDRCSAIQNEWRKATGNAGRELRVHLDSHSVDEVTAGVRRILAAQPRITAVVACTDHFARGAYAAAKSLELPIPERLSVIGVADLDFAAMLTPPLTTIRQDGYQMGRQAAQLELERSAGLLSGAPRRSRVPVTLTERNSTAAANALA